MTRASAPVAVGAPSTAADSTSPPIVLGIVFPELHQFQALVHACARSPAVASHEFSYSAPLYKGNARIVAALGRANSALEKFDAYFEHGFLDEEERVRLARLFAQSYVRKFPGSERQDLFRASADVLRFSLELQPPSLAEDPTALLDAIAGFPHDAAALAALQAGDSIDGALLRGDFRLFLDHVLNPRRREHKAVQAAMAELDAVLPSIVELDVAGAVPGYFVSVLDPLVRAAGGRLVLLA